MRAIAMLLRWRLTAARHAAGLIRRESRLKLAFIAVFGMAVWGGLFAGFLHSFNFLSAHIPELKDVLVRQLLLLFFITLLILLSISNGIIAYASFFKSRETAFLVAAPLRFEHIFTYKLVEVLLFSSWAMLILGGPLLIAYGVESGLRPGYYLASLAFLGVFILLPAELGGFAAMFITLHAPQIRRRAGWGLAAVGVLVAALVGIRVFAGLSDTGAPPELWLKNILDRLRFCQNPLLPSYWVTNGLSAAAQGRWADAGFFWLLTLSNALFGFVLCYAYATRRFRRCWFAAQTPLSRPRVRPRPRAYERLLARLPGLPRDMRLLVVKDIKSFVRDPVQWSQALLFFGLLAVYIVNLRRLSYDIESPYWQNLISFLNLAATSLTLSTFTGRFVFPLLSLEGRRFWLLGLLPVERRAILMGKFAFSFAGSLAISAVLILLSDWMLHAGWLMTALHLVLMALICSGLSGLAVGLGAAYPNLREESPSKIVSGYGGTLTLILSMVYIGVVIGLAAAPCHLYLARGLISPRVFRVWISVAGAASLVIAAAATVLPMLAGLRAFERMEF